MQGDARIQSVLVRVKNRLPLRAVYREPYFTIRALLQRAESGDDIAPELDDRLASVLRTALTRVPYYRNLNLGIRPDEVRAEDAREVLSCFPYLEKDEVMRAPESFVSEAHQVDSLQQATSGGSSGRLIMVFRSPQSDMAESAFFHHAWGKVGYMRRARMVRASAEGKRKDDEEPCSRSGDRLLVSPYHFNERWISRVFEDIQAFRPQFLHMYPSCFEYLADYMSRSGMRLPGISGIFLGSEAVTDRHLDLAGKVFAGVPVIFHYGLTERTNLAWGSRCGGATTYEFERVYGYSENFVHSGSGPEIVGTSYWNECMPLIRYRTQDYGKIVDGVMRNLEGREQEFLVTKSGRRIPGICIDIGDVEFDSIEGIQMVQEEPGKLEFRIKPRPQYDDSVGRRLLISQRNQWGDAFDFTLSITDQVERTPSGKIRRYVVKV